MTGAEPGPESEPITASLQPPRLPEASGLPGSAPSTPRVDDGMREAVLAWYAAQGRFLAFRGTADPYAILVSEAMAQQTQAARAAEAWGRWLVAFPTAAALAAASPADVLRAWRGLGYNRRALALRAAAIEVANRFGGELPRDVAALESLPGVGPYTARAVAALAFGSPVGAVDTNVRRVLLRSVVGGVGDGREDLPAIRPRDLQAIADASVPVDRPGLWTHALMDIGAVFCRPRAPRCADCPAVAWCRTGAARVAPAMDDRAAGPRPAAGSGPGPRRRVAEAPVAFEATTRWLRGRILDRLRDTPDGEWASFDAAIGRHPVTSVHAALAGLAREGLAELDPADAGSGRLPLR